MRRVIIICLLLSLVMLGCGAHPDHIDTASTAPETMQVFAMDTFMDLQAYGPGAKAGLDSCAALLTELDHLISVTDETSEIYQLNHSGSAAVSEKTALLMSAALDLSADAGPALALTVYPILRAWGFTTAEYRIPSDAEIQEMLPLVDDSKVQLDGASVSLPEGAELDLGAVGKGWAGDRAAELLQESGVSSALLSLGGSTIRTLGTKPDGKLWRIAIQDPDDPAGYAGIVEIGEGAVNTSGGYERYFTDEDGTVYWHILDPETGYPADSGLISVTILTEDSFTGDGLSTALFVLGADQAQTLWRQRGDFEFILINQDRNLILSEGAAACFTPKGQYEHAEQTVISHEN